MTQDHRDGAARPSKQEITDLVVELEEAGDSQEAAERLYVAVYAELRSIARKLMRSHRHGHTLQPTALVHEAYLKLVNASRIEWKGRSHFLCIAARAMRQVLVNHARDRVAAKRGGDWKRITIHDEIQAVPDRALEVVSLDDALAKLAREDARMAEVIELRIFGGMTAVEVAHVLGVSKRTVDKDLKVAKLWLLDEFVGRDAS